jgi:hypothetical protein
MPRTFNSLPGPGKPGKHNPKKYEKRRSFWEEKYIKSK